MVSDDFTKEKEYFKILEESIEKLPAEQRGNLYKTCAINCVNDTVLNEQKRQFEECHGNLDLQYSRYGNSDSFFAKIIEKGHIYEIGFPRCVCHMVGSGFAHSPIHCECSRQSILYVLHQLMPERAIKVDILETVLSGAAKCRFRLIVE